MLPSCYKWYQWLWRHLGKSPQQRFKRGPCVGKGRWIDMCVLHLFIYMLRCWRKHELVSFSVVGWLIVTLLLVKSCYDQFCAIINLSFFFFLFFPPFRWPEKQSSGSTVHGIRWLRKNLFFHSVLSSFSYLLCPVRALALQLAEL